MYYEPMTTNASAVDLRPSRRRLSEHHAATAQKHLDYAAVCGDEEAAAAHEHAAAYYQELAAKFRKDYA